MINEIRLFEIARNKNYVSIYIKYSLTRNYPVVWNIDIEVCFKSNTKESFVDSVIIVWSTLYSVIR